MEINVKESHPLKWPHGWERTLIGSRKPQNGWKKNMRHYYDAVVRELKRIGVTEVMVSYNDDIQKQRQDPGVAVYFSKAKKVDFSWQVALGLDSPAPTLADIDDAFKRKAMQHHPDRGGDIEIFHSLSKHRDQAKAWILGTHSSEHEYVIPCDRFDEARLNLNAVRLAVAAFRQLDRVGVPAMLERTFRGFKTALPAHEENKNVPTVA